MTSASLLITAQLTSPDEENNYLRKLLLSPVPQDELRFVLVARPPLLPVEQQEVDHLLRVVARVQQGLHQLLLVL